MTEEIIHKEATKEAIKEIANHTSSNFDFKILTEMSKISIKAEPIFNIGDFHLPNSLFLSFFVLIGFFIIAFYYNKIASSKKKNKFYYFINFALKGIYSFFQSALKENTKNFFPLIGAFFFFIIFNNWAGLLPGVGSILIKVYEHGELHYFPIFRGNNADLNTTLAIALISVIFVQYAGIKYLGFKNYIKKFINLTNPINFFVGILEIISEISKIISFSFRLFGNIFAGEVLLAVMAFLVPVLVSFPFLVLEIFVGFVQALVFSMLSAVFISSAIVKHH
ncbi:MAG: F0F1 ATP synthase subunit A [Patescibacteria group bacterium]|nr:F0F1 ATP synthase subunit A [Patescibacteria group bacterium]